MLPEKLVIEPANMSTVPLWPLTNKNIIERWCLPHSRQANVTTIARFRLTGNAKSMNGISTAEDALAIQSIYPIAAAMSKVLGVKQESNQTPFVLACGTQTSVYFPLRPHSPRILSM